MRTNSQILISKQLDNQKSLAYHPLQQLDLSTIPATPENLIALLKSEIASESFSQHIDRHVGESSTYTLKADLIKSLSIIYHRLAGAFLAAILN